jgi:hypothetical protein
MGERLRWFCLSGFGRYEEERFKAEVLSGHKEDAIEVPFDPALEWGISPKSLWRGRRGHLVNASVKWPFICQFDRAATEKVLPADKR